MENQKNIGNTIITTILFALIINILVSNSGLTNTALIIGLLLGLVLISRIMFNIFWKYLKMKKFKIWIEDLGDKFIMWLFKIKYIRI